MKTIEVIFTDNYIEVVPTTMNKYFFLCSSCEVCVGDLITDNRYDTNIQVVNILDTDEPRYKGISLKLIRIDAIEHRKRAVTITLEQAQEWYKGNNETLKQLALNAYKESELAPTYDYICKFVRTNLTTIIVPDKQTKLFTILSKLQTIANYFNGTWNKLESNTGYFLGKSEISVNAFATSRKNIYIFRHDNVKYPGIVYFKNKEDLITVLNMLSEEDLNNLFY